MHSKIFHKFNRVESITDGVSSIDFLGMKIDCRYKHGWKPLDSGNKIMPNYPSASEWTVDWIACLLAAYLANDKFRVIELGAGYAQWSVTAALAFKQLCTVGDISITALEADQEHFEWMQEHVTTNTLQLTQLKNSLLHAAAGEDGEVSFPILDDPSKVYGASYVETNQKNSHRYNRVISMSLKSVFELDEQNDCVDLLHIDIQGAEKELLENHTWTKQPIVKLILLGTHQSDDLHISSRQHLENAGFDVILDWARNSTIKFNGENINTNDGALLACNPDFIDINLAKELIYS